MCYRSRNSCKQNSMYKLLLLVILFTRNSFKIKEYLYTLLKNFVAFFMFTGTVDLLVWSKTGKPFVFRLRLKAKRENILFFASDSVITSLYSLRLRLNEYRLVITSPSATNCWIVICIARLQSTPYWLIFKIHVATIKFIFVILCRFEPKTVNYP
jgi:hypothetical protein